jgi:hypothetical protein
MNTISLDKKYQTRLGCSVVVHSVTGPDKDLPVVVSIATKRMDRSEDAWMPYYYSADGRYFKEPAGPNPMDLVEVTPAAAEKSYWVNVYRNPDARGGIVLGEVHESKQEAEDSCVSRNLRIECVEFRVPSK